MESFNFPPHFLYSVSLNVEAPFQQQLRGAQHNFGLSQVLSRLIGTWQLVSHYAFVENDPDDRIYPLGPDAQGLLIYTNDGHFSTSLLRPGQDPFPSSELGGPSEVELANAAKRYLGYAGPFSITKAEDTVYVWHNMDLTNFPNWRGNVQTRRIHLDRDTLTMELESFTDVAGTRRRPLLIWTKMPRNDALFGG